VLPSLAKAHADVSGDKSYRTLRETHELYRII